MWWVSFWPNSMNEDVQVSPLRVPAAIIDDPVSNLEQAVSDLQIVFTEKNTAGILKQVGLKGHQQRLSDMELPFTVWQQRRPWMRALPSRSIGVAGALHVVFAKNSSMVLPECERRCYPGHLPACQSSLPRALHLII